MIWKNIVEMRNTDHRWWSKIWLPTMGGPHKKKKKMNKFYIHPSSHILCYYYRKDTELLYHSFIYSLASLLSGIYSFYAMHAVKLLWSRFSDWENCDKYNYISNSSDWENCLTDATYVETINKKFIAYWFLNIWQNFKNGA